MASHIQTTGVAHIRLTVTDIARSRAFYEQVLGFEAALQPSGKTDPETLANEGFLFGGVIYHTNGILFGLRPVAPGGDRFNENRVGLDHFSFTVAGHDDLSQAVRLLDERGTPHSGIKDLGPGSGSYILEFRDPDNIALELLAPYAR